MKMSLFIALFVFMFLNGCTRSSNPTGPLIIPERTDTPEMFHPPVYRSDTRSIKADIKE